MVSANDISFSFPWYEYNSTPHSFLWDSFTRYLTCNRQFFLSALEKHCATCLWVPRFQTRKLLSFLTLSSGIFLNICFQKFYLSAFLWGCECSLKFIQLLDSTVGSYLLPNLGSFTHYFFQELIALLALSPSETLRRRMLNVLSQKPPKLCLLFSRSNSLLFRLGNFYWFRIYGFHSLSFLLYYWVHLLGVYIYIYIYIYIYYYCVFHVYIFIWFLKLNPMFLLIFVFHSFQELKMEGKLTRTGINPELAESLQEAAAKEK